MDGLEWRWQLTRMLVLGILLLPIECIPGKSISKREAFSSNAHKVNLNGFTETKIFIWIPSDSMDSKRNSSSIPVTEKEAFWADSSESFSSWEDKEEVLSVITTYSLLRVTHTINEQIRFLQLLLNLEDIINECINILWNDNIVIIHRDVTDQIIVSLMTSGGWSHEMRSKRMILFLVIVFITQLITDEGEGNVEIIAILLCWLTNTAHRILKVVTTIYSMNHD